MHKLIDLCLMYQNISIFEITTINILPNMKKNMLSNLFVVLLVCITIATKAQPINGTTTFFTNTTTVLNSNTACTITKTCTLSGWLFSISSTSNCGQNWTNSSGGDGRFQNLVGFGTLTQITFGSDDGSEFALNNLIWGVSTSSWTSKPMQFVGYKNGLPVPGATLNATTPSGTGILNTLIVTFTSNAAFNDVDDVRLAPNSSTCSSILFFEEITVGTATPACITPTLNLSSQTNVLCNGNSTGSATMSANGGSPFTYTWSPSGGNAPIATGLSAGIYTCVTTNSCGSIASRTVNITQPTALNTATAVTNVLCFGNSTGAATVTASGGVGGNTFLWSSAQTTSVITGLNAGVRTVTVTNSNGCTATNTVNITQPASALTTATAVTNVLCFGNSTGAATVTASGGVGGNTFLWSSAQTTSVISGLNAGIRTVTVTNSNGCTATNTVVITQPSSLSVTINPASPVICSGSSQTLSGSPSGGTGGVTYLWNTGATTQSISVSPLTNTNYTLTITDANSCTLSAVKIVTVNTTPTITVNNGAICSGSSFTMTPSGASTYTYQGGSNVVSPTASTSYTVIGTSAQGCVGNTATSNVTVNALPIISAPAQTICAGATGTLTASGASTYTWNTGSNSNFITASPVTTTNYTVNGTSAQGCLGSAIVTTITVGAGPVIVVNSPSICAGNSATLTASGVTTFTWNTGANSNSIVVTPTTNTTYTVSGNLLGCGVGANNTSTVSVNALPNVSVVSSETNILCVGQSATLTAGGANTYVWLPVTSSGTSIVISPTITANYTVTGTSAQGCSANAVITQSVDACTGVKNTFNPTFDVVVYPNPSNGIFNIQLPNESTIEVTDELGRLILKEKANAGNYQLNLGKNVNGIYFVKATVNGKTKTVKVVKE